MESGRTAGTRAFVRLVRTSLVAGMLATAAAVAAADPPNFSGTWKIDVAKSTPTAGGGRYFTQDASLSDVTLVITQTNDELVIERTVGERMGRSALRLDGSENDVEGPRGGRYHSEDQVGRNAPGHRRHAGPAGTGRRGADTRHRGSRTVRGRQDHDGDDDREGPAGDQHAEAGVREAGPMSRTETGGATAAQAPQEESCS